MNIIDNLISQVGSLIIVCGATERIIQFTKAAISKFYKKKLSSCTKDMIAIIISIGFCLLTGINFNIGIEINEYVSRIIAGLLVSFGGTTLHTALGYMQSIKDINKTDNSCG